MSEEMAPYTAGVTREEFLPLVWRFEELMMLLDYLRGRIGKCENKCDEEDDGFCPSCCAAFEEVRAEEERLGRYTEYNETMSKLKHACLEDKSGRYQRILEQTREVKVVH